MAETAKSFNHASLNGLLVIGQIDALLRAMALRG